MAFQRTAVAALVAFLLPAAALAQSGTSTIAGAVTDSTAGALRGVAVRDHDGHDGHEVCL